MAIFTPLIMLVMLSTMAAANRDDWGLFGCPDFTDDTDDSVSYDDAISIGLLSLRILSGGPYKVFSGAESYRGREFSCIVLTQTFPLSPTFTVSYYENGLESTTTLTWYPFEGKFKGEIPEGLLNSPDDDEEVEFTIVSDIDGFLMLKTCKGAFLSHYTSTYILTDNTVDAAELDTDCVAAVYDERCGRTTWPKGICS